MRKVPTLSAPSALQLYFEDLGPDTADLDGLGLNELQQVPPKLQKDLVSASNRHVNQGL